MRIHIEIPELGACHLQEDLVGGIWLGIGDHRLCPKFSTPSWDLALQLSIQRERDTGNCPALAEGTSSARGARYRRSLAASSGQKLSGSLFAYGRCRFGASNDNNLKGTNNYSTEGDRCSTAQHEYVWKLHQPRAPAGARL